MKVLVCGDRNWTNRSMIWDVLDALRNGHQMIVIEGHARGADKAAHDWAVGNRNLGVQLVCMPANWERYGKAAGPIRNREMLEHEPDLVLAFHDAIETSKGTADMLTIAADADVAYALVGAARPPEPEQSGAAPEGRDTKQMLVELAEAAQGYLDAQVMVGVTEDTMRRLHQRLGSLAGPHLRTFSGGAAPEGPPT